MTENKQETNIREDNWSDIIELKSKLVDDNIIDCRVESVNIKKDYAYLNVKPLNVDIQKRVKFDTKVNTDRKSEFEVLLENLGIVPTEDDIEDKLTNRIIEFKILIDNNSIIFDKYCIENNRTEGGTINHLHKFQKIDKLKQAYLTLTLFILLYISVKIIIAYGVFSYLFLLFHIIFTFTVLKNILDII